MPTQLTPFLGRAQELAELRRLLGAPECRLVTLVGPGGMGKTRLAIQSASALAPTFPHGVAFVALTALTQSEQLVPAIADAIQFSFPSPTGLQRQLLHHLRDKVLLLVLDNFEHLLGEGQSIAYLQSLLHGAPGLKVLVTSREPLNIQGEWAFEVEGLGTSATELFVQSARRVRAGFALQDDDQPWVAQICRLVGEMPLGIELAASWMRVLPLPEIVSEIERSIDFLTTTARDMPARHRSIRAVFDHSWHLLAPEERQGLKRLAVFRGGFRREAAEQIAGVSLSLLSSLVAKSLLHRAPASRYDLHELIRQYAADHLQQEAVEAAQTQARHGRYFAAWLQQNDHWIRGVSQPEGAATIRAEMENIRLAWQWAITQGETTQLQQLLFTVFWFYDITNRFQEGIAAFQQAAEALEHRLASISEPSTAVQATLGHVLAFEGWFRSRYGHLASARERLERSVHLLRPLSAPVALSDALRAQGFLYYLCGDVENTRQSLTESLTLKCTVGDSWEPSFGLVHRGLLAYVQGQYEEACRWFGEALAHVRRLGYTQAMARALLRLSASTLALGLHQEAKRHAQESLQLSQAHEDHWGVASALQLLGMIAQTEGSNALGQACAFFQQSLTLFRTVDDHWSVARVLNHLGDTLLQMGETPAAATCFREAVSMALAVQAWPQVLDAIIGLATIAQEAGELEQALYLAIAVECQQQAGSQAKTRARQLQQSVVTHLTSEQVAAIRANSAGQPLEQFVKTVLEPQSPTD